MIKSMKQKELSKLLLEWYGRSGRELPWRKKGGAHPDPYVILVSEFMLQQTGVKTVIPYFERFMKRFPTVRDLANAPLEDVYLCWQGLGYYSRARSLHASAKMIMDEFGGKFPKTRAEVLKLKGVGAYTASSFLALAFNLPETVVDGNVIRVICRLYHLTSSVDEILDAIREKAEALTDKEHPADYASAIMDLGAMICTPKNPRCLLCPWCTACLSKDCSELERIPLRSRLAKKEKRGSVILIFRRDGGVFIRKRSEKGLLSGLYEFPWQEDGVLFEGLNPEDTGLEVSHVFTHFKLILRIFIARAEDVCGEGFFIDKKELSAYPFSTLMKKVYAVATTKFEE